MQGRDAGYIRNRVMKREPVWCSWLSVQRRDAGDSRNNMLEMELTGKRIRGRPKRRFMDVVRADMWEVGTTEVMFWEGVEERCLIYWEQGC